MEKPTYEELESRIAGLEAELAAFTNRRRQKYRRGKNMLPSGSLDFLINSNFVGIAVATFDGKLLLANDYYLNLIGYGCGADLNRINWKEITPAEWALADQNALRELSLYGTCTPYEKEYMRCDGSRVTVLLADALLPGPEYHIAAMVIDMTPYQQKIKNLQDEVAFLGKQLAKSENYLSLLSKYLDLSIISLQGKSQSPSTTGEDPMPATLERQAKKLADSTEEVLLTLENFRQLSAFKLGLLEFSPRTFSLDSLSQRLITKLASKTGIRFETDIPEFLLIRADEAMFETMFRNLAMLTIRLTSPGEVVHIQALQADDHGVEIRFIAGPPSNGNEDQNHAFAELAMTICFEFTQRHGGKLRLNGCKDSGSCIELELP